MFLSVLFSEKNDIAKWRSSSLFCQFLLSFLLPSKKQRRKEAKQRYFLAQSKKALKWLSLKIFKTTLSRAVMYIVFFKTTALRNVIVFFKNHDASRYGRFHNKYELAHCLFEIGPLLFIYDVSYKKHQQMFFWKQNMPRCFKINNSTSRNQRNEVQDLMRGFELLYIVVERGSECKSLLHALSFLDGKKLQQKKMLKTTRADRAKN